MDKESEKTFKALTESEKEYQRQLAHRDGVKESLTVLIGEKCSKGCKGAGVHCRHCVYLMAALDTVDRYDCKAIKLLCEDKAEQLASEKSQRGELNADQ